MTYNAINAQTKQTAIIELSLSASQVASAGDGVVFDTIKATGPHGVSVDVNGAVTLSADASYWIQASIDVERSSVTSSWAFSWHDANGALTPSEGAYGATWDYHPSTSTTAQPNATFTATLVTTSASIVTLRADVLAANSSITTNTRVIIVEVSQ